MKMHSFTAVIASMLLLATSAFAVPGANWEGSWGSGNVARSSTCMSDSEAQVVANNFQNLIAEYSDALANASLTSNFYDYSDSVIELINNACPNSPVDLGTATFNSRASFEVGQGSQPPIPFKQLNVWHNCNTVTVRWVSAQTPSQITGIIVLETVYQNNTWLIQTVYSEFNSGAWLVNLGVFKPTNCTA